jgi:HD-GYP domain-containing protein (c-di-GMP phosphodiesterase class II)
MLDSRRYFNGSGIEALERVLVEVARRLGLTHDEKATLQYVFSVYDLGLAKSGCDVVKQNEPLTKEDRKDIEQHTIVGTEMMKPIELTPDVRNAVLYHHENYDGTGYPGKLAGEEIPIYARIIRVADTFRALISHRPYQKRYSVKDALDVLTHRAGTFFDPKIVKVFVEIVRTNKDDFGTEWASSLEEKKDAVGAPNSPDSAANSQGGY